MNSDKMNGRSNMDEQDYLAEQIAKKVAGFLEFPIRLLDKYEVAKMLKVSVSTVERQTKSRVIPAIKIGDCLRYNPSNVMDELRAKGK